LQELKDYPQRPLKQRICRTLKKIAPTTAARRKLWQSVLERFGTDTIEGLTSGDILSTWNMIRTNSGEWLNEGEDTLSNQPTRFEDNLFADHECRILEKDNRNSVHKSNGSCETAPMDHIQDLKDNNNRMEICNSQFPAPTSGNLSHSVEKERENNLNVSSSQRNLVLESSLIQKPSTKNDGVGKKKPLQKPLKLPLNRSYPPKKGNTASKTLKKNRSLSSNVSAPPLPKYPKSSRALPSDPSYSELSPSWSAQSGSGNSWIQAGLRPSASDLLYSHAESNNSIPEDRCSKEEHGARHPIIFPSEKPINDSYGDFEGYLKSTQAASKEESSREYYSQGKSMAPPDWVFPSAPTNPSTVPLQFSESDMQMNYWPQDPVYGSMDAKSFERGTQYGNFLSTPFPTDKHQGSHSTVPNGTYTELSTSMNPIHVSYEPACADWWCANSGQSQFPNSTSQMMTFPSANYSTESFEKDLTYRGMYPVPTEYLGESQNSSISMSNLLSQDVKSNSFISYGPSSQRDAGSQYAQQTPFCDFVTASANHKPLTKLEYPQQPYHHGSFPETLISEGDYQFNQNPLLLRRSLVPTEGQQEYSPNSRTHQARLNASYPIHQQDQRSQRKQHNSDLARCGTSSEMKVSHESSSPGPTTSPYSFETPRFPSKDMRTQFKISSAQSQGNTGVDYAIANSPPAEFSSSLSSISSSFPRVLERDTSGHSTNQLSGLCCRQGHHSHDPTQRSRDSSTVVQDARGTERAITKLSHPSLHKSGASIVSSKLHQDRASQRARLGTYADVV
jgi:hypothetical protein